MNITKTLYTKNRKEWRDWLKTNHSKEKEIWLIYYKKRSSKPRISYNDAVEEALCFGWIDSIVKKLDEESFAQKFTPRKSSNWSEMNKERARRLIIAGRMTKPGFDRLPKDLHDNFIIPNKILNAIKSDDLAWKHFQSFPEGYKRVRIGYIREAHNSKEFKKRLANFIKMTSKNKMFGMVK